MSAMTSKSEDSDVTEITEKKNRTGTSGVEKQKQKDILLIQIKRRKRTAKIKVTNLRHEITDIKSVIEPLWAALEDAQEILEEITAFYVEVEVKEQAVKKEPFEESEAIKRDVKRTIEAGQNAIKVRASKTVNMNKPFSENTTDRYQQSAIS